MEKTPEIQQPVTTKKPYSDGTKRKTTFSSNIKTLTWSQSNKFRTKNLSWYKLKFNIIFFTKLLHLKKIIKQDKNNKCFFWLPLIPPSSWKLFKCGSHFDHVIKKCDLVGGFFEITCGSEAYQHYAREKVT